MPADNEPKDCMNRKPHVIGNWKMHGSKILLDDFFTQLCVGNHLKNLQAIEKVICPPFVYLGQAAKQQEQIPEVKLGAQDVSSFESGAYTGQIAAQMLVEHSCEYAIVGHSERRLYCQESDEEIANKFFAAKAAGLIPILCVGETQAQWQQKLTEKVVVDQLFSILKRQGAKSFKNAIIAYEPIWAIGTGLTATPEQAQSVHHLLRRTLAEYDESVAKALPLLYGGSVKAGNAKGLFAMPDIDGALVGGASLNALEFLAICEAGLGNV